MLQNSLSERKCVLEQKYDDELLYSYILNGFFVFLNVFLLI